MGKIIDFRTRKEAEPRTLPQDEPLRSKLGTSSDPENDDLEAEMDAAKVEIPSWEDLFDDDRVTFEDKSVAEWRRKLDVSTPEGRNERVRVENAVIYARSIFIGNSIRMTNTLRFQAEIRLGKEAYLLGLEMNEPEPRQIAQAILVSRLGPSGAAKVIENINIRHRLSYSG